jgi:hypothetical protein
MASTYVNDLRLNEMATGDASGSWGTVTNTNLELIGEAFSYGTETIGDADSTLTIADGAADAARSFYLKITSSVDLTTTRIVTLGPNTVSKVWMIENATTGSQVITIKQGSGATINVPNGQVKMISTDGAGSGGAVLDLLVDVDLTGTTTLVNLNVSGAVDIAGDLTLSAGGDGALRFTAASSVKVLDNNAAALVFEEADNAYMTFVTTDGSEAVKFDKALDINAATQIDATVTVGVDDTGYDVKFFGATAGAYMLWDESADDLILGGAAGLSVNSTALVTGVLTTTAATVSNGGGQFNGAINVGVDDTGYDVKFFGATAGKYMLWDESADTLEVSGTVVAAAGTALLPSITTTGDLNTGMWFPAADTIAFSEGGVEALRIDSSGKVLVGKASSDFGTAGIEIDGANYRAWITRSGAEPLALNRLTNDGNLIEFAKDGTTVGSIGAFTSGTSAFFFGSLDTALLANSGNDSIHPWNASTNTNRDNAIDLGNAANRFKDLYLSGGVRATGSLDITIPETAGAAINMEFGNAANDTRRTVIFYKDAVWPAAADTTVINLGGPSNKFKDLYLSGGVYLGGTGAANKLDDYEEGTCTLTLTGGTTAPTVAQTATGTYTKVGNTVTVVVTFGNKDVTGVTGNVTVTGFPFTSISEIHLGHFSNSRGSADQYAGYMSGSGTAMVQINYNGNALTWASTGPGTYAFITVTYITT